MTWQAERATVNQRVQIGTESTPGISVAAGKHLDCFDWTLGIEADIQQYRATGHKYPSEQVENTEWVPGTLGGAFDYNGVVYPLAGVCGVTTPGAHGSSATAKDWAFTPPIIGSVQPQTFTIQQGDTTRAHSLAYGLFTAFGYKGDRKGITVSGSLVGQPLSDGITLTATPTAIALAPIAASQVNYYLDSSTGSLGSTQLLRVLSVDYSFSGLYSPFWAFNRGNVGFTGHVDQAPKCAIKLLVEADSQGMALRGYLQDGSTHYLRVQAIGAQIASDGPGAVNQTFTHDMAVKIGKPSNFSDKDGIFAIEWECTIFEDATWGKSQTITVTNLITAL